ncbi:chromosome segregation protein SMC [Anaerosporobacter faecicola]|uniref:chromosome segregation protein SMC n=1 Tax=Anaerosporobacter faecicola TaxID=2718714 RepID=UPI00143AC917|nr:chromosome segregation protein SMC [Anaerosporobacter faecicola]
MYLKSLEIQGFKSFANKLIFEFKGGITGIVGPNGSGKSNVADAVRWVLGEQSAKQLRGAKMEDIIFSGTQTRKPLGFAYVAITLDNSDHQLAIDFDEVKVARRVYRSGESEYMINGTNCRLKDVQELFLDTGIGKEGYSIIGQGQIDKILSGKPEDRRELFDEAAGIVKFKKRKATAEKNLEEEKQNLCRINDILAEIEKQVEPLEKQAGVAKEYLKFKEELKELDVNMFLVEYERILEEQKSIEDKLQIAQGNLKQSKESFDQTKEEYEKLESQIEEFDTALEEKKIDLNNYRLHKEKLEGDIKVFREQIAASEQNRTHYQERIDSISKEVQLKKEQLNQYYQQKSKLDEKIDSFDDVQNETNEELKGILSEMEEITRTIEACNSEIYKNLDENANRKAEIQKYETIVEQSSIQKASLNQRLLKNKSDEAVLQQEWNQKQESLQTITASMQEIREQNIQVENKLQELQNNIKEKEDAFRVLQQKYHQEKSRMDSLKNMTERYEGYGNSIRKIMEQKQQNPGIEGVVADIIKVKKEYETAVEIALGGSIQNIVTDNESTAKSMIEFLKKNKFGRATFLPLTSISARGGFKDSNVLNETGVIGLANSLVDHDEKYKGLVDYLLGRIVVVDTIDHAITISKRYNYSLRIVTVEGELLSPGGSMSGGAYKNSSNLLSRRREIEEIESKVTAFANQMKENTAFVEQCKNDREANRRQYETNKTKLQEYSIEQNTVKMQMQQMESKKAEIRTSYDEIKKESTSIDLQAIELKNVIQQLQEQQQNTVNKNQNAEESIAAFTKQLEEKKAAEKTCTDKIASMKLDCSTLEQQNAYVVENIKRVKEEVSRFEEELSDTKSKLLQAKDTMQAKVSMTNHTKEQLEADEKRIAILSHELEEMVIKKEKLSKDHKAFLARREELSNMVNELDKENFRLSGQKDKLMEQLDAQVTYMWQEYELTYSLALEKKNEAYDNIPQMKKMIQSLKQQIKALGDVNVNAIEDYKNLLDRYELLKTQHDDLIEAEEALKKIIEELDIEMRKQFNEKFGEIKSQFDLVFKELFGGGKGTLELMEGEDILEAGIRIIAQPPGKKLQNMMQLSGGEKALTAISLLFAIQNLKPSPFCLLDEIEAALDDANVKRFANYLHKLTKHTQFIVITHRRGTMESVDTLYGVTMQEKGVSTLVSVSLIEDELEDKKA